MAADHCSLLRFPRSHLEIPTYFATRLASTYPCCVARYLVTWVLGLLLPSCSYNCATVGSLAR
jgi:hypothetical protein